MKEKEELVVEMDLTCNQCQFKFKVPDWLDTRIKCPKCRASVTNPKNTKNKEPWDRERLPVAFPD